MRHGGDAGISSVCSCRDGYVETGWTVERCDTMQKKLDTLHLLLRMIAFAKDIRADITRRAQEAIQDVDVDAAQSRQRAAADEGA